ncbi:probable galactinol--sucrose galactosyltransferase 2 [Setaria italica]|uniref:probable galactinol--sucrose galactosyltransferase 2 n=1 Tax=Setaria italica TaxID=4555 RepID=UPI000350FC82|nr:probable galactinol--sucrose galactosyltransferase 2 [Setaria italica]XP_034586809.1 probable galactinol--sucrose galactosyltransferase 2 [Setaria viridis]
MDLCCIAAPRAPAAAAASAHISMPPSRLGSRGELNWGGDAVWNVNACGRRRGGAPQLQGAGWCCVAKRTRVHDAAPGTLTGAVHAAEVDAIARFAAGGEDGDGEWDGEAVVYAHGAGELVRLPRGAAVPVTLCPLEYELFHLRPPRRAPGGVAFAHVAMPPR